jgi:hypothetical protein
MSKQFVPVFVAALLAGGGASEAGQRSQGPTFAKDVAPILYKNCVLCHRTGEVAPMSLVTYEDVRPWARAIRTRVIAREMPPWPADDTGHKMRNDRRLSQRAIDTIVAWVDAGAPFGNQAELPAPPTFTVGWAHPEGIAPDYVIDAPEVELPAEGEIPMVNVYSRVPFTETMFAEAAQLLPGNRAVVHHEIAYLSTLPPSAKLDDNGRLVGGERRTQRNTDLAGDDAFEPSRHKWLVGFVPGGGFLRYAPGVGNRILAGPDKYIRFDLHYTTIGKPQTDVSKFGIWAQKVPFTHELTFRRIGEAHIAEGREIVGQGAQPPTGGNRSLPNIPPHAPNFAVTAITPVLEDITIFNFQVHMHLRGKDMKIVAVYPDGREDVLVSVPKYNFEWQLFYELEQPVKVPAGSKLMSIGHLDNSANNKSNPAPDKEVIWGEQTWDEMFNGWINYIVDKNDLSKTRTDQP